MHGHCPVWCSEGLGDGGSKWGVKGNKEQLEHLCMSEEIKVRWLNAMSSNSGSLLEFT